MSGKAVIIDCDPGVDDAIALLWAFGAPALEIIAVTTVAGNVEAALTARNACIIRQIAGREEVPIHAGAGGPLVRTPVGASHFHGESGLGWLAMFEPASPVAPGHAADAIITAVRTRPPKSVSIAMMGPMTNLALALRLAPDIAGRLAEVVIMGGARSEGGNITASAEYNVHADPHAAQIVLNAGLSCVMLGLDVTHQARATPPRRAAIKAVGSPSAVAAAKLLDFCADVQHRLVGPGADPPMHDPCTIAWLLAPQLFETVPARVEVDLASPLTLGHTAVEFRLRDGLTANTRWATQVDADGLFAMLQKVLCS